MSNRFANTSDGSPIVTYESLGNGSLIHYIYSNLKRKE